MCVHVCVWVGVCVSLPGAEVDVVEGEATAARHVDNATSAAAAEGGACAGRRERDEEAVHEERRRYRDARTLPELIQGGMSQSASERASERERE